MVEQFAETLFPHVEIQKIKWFQLNKLKWFTHDICFEIIESGTNYSQSNQREHFKILMNEKLL